MKKKIYSLLLMLVCIFALSACGEEVRVQKNSESIGLAPEVVIEMVMSPVQPGIAYSFATIDEFEHYLRQMSSSDVSQMLAVVAGWKSYQASISDIGDPQIDTTQPMYFKQGSDDGVIAVYHISGTSHPATIEFAYNSYDELQSVTVNVQLTLEEAMKNAATNTAIGMGTVFVMLIVIMFIISAFKAIPTLQEMFSKKEEAPAEASVDKAIEGIIEREAAEDETDDNELIAVIAAAIAAAQAAAGSSAETSTEGFVVRSIRRIK